MTCSNSKNKHSGFTIIELLVVIVIIAILTTITVVAYNGIQNRSAAAKASTVASTYAKALEMYYIDNGHFPATGENQPICLGTTDNYPATDLLEEGQCSNFDSFTASVDETFNQTVLSYISSVPDGSLPSVVLGEYAMRGIIYQTDEDTQAYALFYVMIGDVASSCYSTGNSSEDEETGQVLTECGHTVDYNSE
jgi:prepilin-type N-terminal cleavage/methylation domain-containing protein